MPAPSQPQPDQRRRATSTASADRPHPETTPPPRQPGFHISIEDSSQPAGRDPGSRSTPPLEAPPSSLPGSYPETRLWAVARDPYWIFSYWHLEPPIVRIPGARLTLILTRQDGVREATYAIESPAGSRFIPVSLAGMSYLLTLGFMAHGGWSLGDLLFTVREQRVTTPRDRPLEPGPEDASSRRRSSSLFTGVGGAKAPEAQDRAEIKRAAPDGEGSAPEPRLSLFTPGGMSSLEHILSRNTGAGPAAGRRSAPFRWRVRRTGAPARERAGFHPK